MWLISTWLVGGNLPFQLSAGEFTIGRSKDCRIVVRDSSVSRVHAQLTVSPAGDMILTDLKSENGVFANHQLVAEMRPGKNTRVRLGSVPIIFSDNPRLHGAEDDMEPTPPPRGVRLKYPSHLPSELSLAQRVVLQLASRGLSDEEIADTLGRSHNTVRNHLKVIFKVYGVNSKPRLLAMLNGKR